MVPSFRSALSLRVGWVEHSETHHLRHGPVGFAELVIGRRFAPTRWLNPPYEKNERKWNADRRCNPTCRAAGTAAPPAGGARLSASHRGSDPRESSSQGLCLRPCFLGRGISVDPVVDPLPGQHRRSFCGRYPPSPVPVQRAPRAPVVLPAGMMPKAARERLAIPPAGTALAPEPRCASAAGPFTERESRNQYVTEIVTSVNTTVTIILSLATFI